MNNFFFSCTLFDKKQSSSSVPLKYQITLFVFMFSFILVYRMCLWAQMTTVYRVILLHVFPLLPSQTVLPWLEFVQTQLNIDTRYSF